MKKDVKRLDTKEKILKYLYIAALFITLIPGLIFTYFFAYGIEIAWGIYVLISVPLVISSILLAVFKLAIERQKLSFLIFSMAFLLFLSLFGLWRTVLYSSRGYRMHSIWDFLGSGSCTIVIYFFAFLILLIFTVKWRRRIRYEEIAST